MAKTVRQAEAEVLQARAALAEDVSALEGWFYGVAPLTRFLMSGPRFRRRCKAGVRNDGAVPFASRVADGLCANPLPLFLVALGAGLMLKDAVRRVGDDEDGYSRHDLRHR